MSTWVHPNRQPPSKVVSAPTIPERRLMQTMEAGKEPYWAAPTLAPTDHHQVLTAASARPLTAPPAPQPVPAARRLPPHL